MGKALLGLCAAVAATIIAANIAYNATANTATEPVNEPWAQDRMEFLAWNGQKWTGWIRGNEFEQTPANESIEEALFKYLCPTTLEGDNAYNCSGCEQKVTAQKGDRLDRLPKILTL